MNTNYRLFHLGFSEDCLNDIYTTLTLRNNVPFQAALIRKINDTLKNTDCLVFNNGVICIVKSVATYTPDPVNECISAVYRVKQLVRLTTSTPAHTLLALNVNDVIHWQRETLAAYQKANKGHSYG